MQTNELIIKKLEQLFDKLGMDQNERDAFYLTIMQYVGQETHAIIEGVLTEEDWDYLENCDEDAAAEYIDQRVKKETGKYPQEISDEVMRQVLERAQVEGIKELLNHIHNLM